MPPAAPAGTESGSGTGHGGLGAAAARRGPRRRGLHLRRRGAGVGRETGATAAWFPAAGVGVLALLVAPRVAAGRFARRPDGRVRPGQLHRRPVGGGLALLGVADTVEVVLVGWLVLRLIGRRMRDVKDVWRLFAIAAVGALVAGLLVALDLRRHPGHGLLDDFGWSRPRTPPRCCCWRRWRCSASDPRPRPGRAGWSWSRRCLALVDRDPADLGARAPDPRLRAAAGAGLGGGPVQRLGRGRGAGALRDRHLAVHPARQRPLRRPRRHDAGGAARATRSST